MNLSFEQNWEKVVSPLKGRTVRTLRYKKVNKIIEVTKNHLVLKPKKSLRSQPIPKEIFEIIYKYIMDHEEITRVEINKAMPERFSSIVCAILAKFPNIGYDIKPIKLYRKNL